MAVSPVNSDVKGKNSKESEIWGYQFLGDRAISNLIADFADNGSVRGSLREERAEEIISRVTDNSSLLFYLRRREVNHKYPGEEIWELTVATDTGDSLPDGLQKCRRTLWLRATVNPHNSSAGLKLLDGRLVDFARGKRDGFTKPFYLRLVPDYQVGIPMSAVKRVQKIPFWCDRHIPNSEQLQVWQTFLNIEERIAQGRQFCVAFVGYDVGRNVRYVTFKLNPEKATLDGSVERSLSEDLFWEKLKNARNEDLMLAESVSDILSRRNTERLGVIADINRQSEKVKILLNDDLFDDIAARKYSLPNKGFLYFEATGDIHQINRKKKALESLQLGRAQNPYLSKFLFDATQARNPEKVIKLEKKHLLNRNANPDQMAAVEAVLSAPDLVLIQGPPGTGKTTVIAEICYQIALRGGKTLIASQANLAVDNALSRLQHNPVIRALRRGKEDKVGDEGQVFLEDNVIEKWLRDTANDCEVKINQRHSTVKVLQVLVPHTQRFEKYLKIEEEFRIQHQEWQETQLHLEAKYQKQEVIYQEAKTEIEELKPLLNKLQIILASTPNIDWSKAEVAEFLPLLQPYTVGEEKVEIFLKNVRKAVHHAGLLGLKRPEGGAFALAEWIQNSVAPSVTQYEKVLNVSNKTINAISEVGRKVQTFEQASQLMKTLQQKYQGIFVQQQEVEKKIQRQQQRKNEIDFIIGTIKEWKSTAHNHIQQVIKNCFGNNQPFTEKLLQLPSGLVTIATSSQIPLLPANYEVDKVDFLPDWQKIRKALVYEIEKGCINLRGKTCKFGDFMHRTFSQIPFVLNNSDRAEWQKYPKRFINYSPAKPEQRRVIVREAGDFLTKMQVNYGASWEEINLDFTAHSIATELLEIILENARKCILPLKTETERCLQRLQEQLKEEKSKTIDVQQQFDDIQYQIETAREETNTSLQVAIKLLEKLNQEPNLPANISQLSQEYLQNQSYIWENPQNFSTQVYDWGKSVESLLDLIPELQPIGILEYIDESLNTFLHQLQVDENKANQELDNIKTKIDLNTYKLQEKISSDLNKERQWWEKIWHTIPHQLKSDTYQQDLADIEYLRLFQQKFQTWQKQLEKIETNIQRYDNFVQDWVTKLRQRSPEDEAELKQIYLQNANVIGITCVQAAKGDFVKEFPNFDVVLIDEVSKCTPPELLIPALKGKKIVLVGDHRQLPPMFRNSTIEDIAEEMGTTKEELSFIKEALFKTLFESADAKIKQMLTTQYRMHPQIMGAINQFYQGKLNCGLPQPDKQRAHHFTNHIIPENKHLLWIKTPLNREYSEQKEGTSRFNFKEVEIIEKLCDQLDKTWSEKVALGEPKKEIGIITFYGAQLRLIKDTINSSKFSSLNIRTGTVDIFQGMERPVIIVSTVCNNNRGDIGFAKAPERVNVAFSRAQELLVIVGCHDLFTQQSGKVGKMYQEVANVVKNYQGLIDAENFNV
ncbi:MAG: AAA domain-containing protein [Cyanobacteria bacterium P01_A01_bin.84]